MATKRKIYSWEKYYYYYSHESRTTALAVLHFQRSRHKDARPRESSARTVGDYRGVPSNSARRQSASPMRRKKPGRTTWQVEDRDREAAEFGVSYRLAAYSDRNDRAEIRNRLDRPRSTAFFVTSPAGRFTSGTARDLHRHARKNRLIDIDSMRIADRIASHESLGSFGCYQPRIGSVVGRRKKISTVSRIIERNC